jgi:hypothetical protein
VRPGFRDFAESLLRYQSGSTAAGARPEPLRPSTVPSGSTTIAKQSPPIPVDCGSTTVSVADAATAASTALPPRFSTSIAESVASGCDVAAMPFSE